MKNISLIFLVIILFMYGCVSPTSKSLFHRGDFELGVYENYKKAISYYRAGIKKQPNSDIAYSRVSFCYFKLGKYGAAENNIKKAIEIDAEQPYHYYFLGVILRKEEETRQAIFAFNKALEVAKATNDKKWDSMNNYAAYTHLGSIYFKLVEYDKAKGYFKNAICKDTNIRVYAYYCLGLIYLKLNKIEEAKDSFLKMTQIVDKGKLNYRGYLYWSLDMYGYDLKEPEWEEIERLIKK